MTTNPAYDKLIRQLGPQLYMEGEVYKLRTGEEYDITILPRDLVNAAIDNAHGTLLTGHGVLIRQ